MILRRLLPVLLLAGGLGGSAVEAQPNKPWKSWFGHVAVGYVIPTGNASDLFDDGWTVLGGATYRPEDWPAGATFELGYEQFDVQDRVSGSLGAWRGETNVWHLTGGGLWTTRRQGLVNFYLSAQIGLYHLDTELSGSARSDVETTWGVNYGMGLTFTVGNDSQLYLEARWHYAAADRRALEWVPVNFGFRW